MGDLNMRLYYSLFILSFMCAPLSAYDFIRHTDDLEHSRFFDTSFISNYPAVKKVLLAEENFTEVFFPTPAGHVLQGLFRKVANPDFTIIFCSGFIPGKQEGIATFITMMPKNCNILFFNGHGKGKSTGLLSFINLLNYGRYDYMDTLGAINYAHFMNQGPLFIHGICAGAFHAAHALYHVRDLTQSYNIAGFICDSVWSSVDQVTIGVVDDELSRTTSYFKRFSLRLGRFFAAYIASPLVRRYAHETDLTNKITALQMPTLFIHSHDDTLTTIAPAQRLAGMVRNTEQWWIETPSKHACHHLKYKYQYAEKLASFISRALDNG